ncbi:hypothetical protein AYL99_00076 [Fonsecaea erecta]|uniref:Arrestin-like N-terminal domain-containing protein n=1 Tax=Fonsecaea erecta TaxID=1367422 RepID=A0A178ZWF7_9EURO|nr:hypothetical protein AYL99_00076 [Fonsecaea erecta]OAP64104.1 hypothetical protein AYL99_00076 [Fonsecaea erecta]
MPLSIQLPPKIGPYHPNSRFSGTINLTSPESVSIGSLVITFTGISLVRLTQNYGDLNVSSNGHHSREVLFRREKVLYTGGKWTHRAGVYSIPFEFSVPEYTDARVVWRCPGAHRAVQSTHKHGLPPTMLYSCPRFTCLVEYVLEATLKPPSTSPAATMVKGITAKRNISVLPQFVNRNPTSRADCHSYVRHHQGFRCGSQENPMSRILKFSKLQRDAPKKGSAATASSLSVSVLLPRRIEVQEDYSKMSMLFSSRSVSNTGTCATASRPNLTASAAAVLTVKSLKLEIIQHTHVQAGHYPSTSTRKTYTRKTTCSLPLPVYPRETLPAITSTADAVETAAPGEVDLAELTQLRIPRDSLVLDFATYNAAVRHTLTLEIGIEYEERIFKFACQDVKIAVVSASSTPEQSGSRAEDPRIRGQAEYGSSRTEAGIALAQGSDQEGQNIEIEARHRAGGNVHWVVPPAEVSSTGVYYHSEWDAFFSEPPPRYTPRS